MRAPFVAAAAILSASAALVPPRLLQADVPGLSPLAVGWQTAVITAKVTESGTVTGVRTVSGGTDWTPKAWRFRAATIDNTLTEAPILVAVLLRPPENRGATSPPDLAANASVAGTDVPVPTAAPAPAFPPNAVETCVVILEVIVGADGSPESPRVVHSCKAFDRAAVDAASHWRFRPAARDGQPVRSSAYLVFGFRPPAE
jgi:TonB family protein